MYALLTPMKTQTDLKIRARLERSLMYLGSKITLLSSVKFSQSCVQKADLIIVPSFKDVPGLEHTLNMLAAVNHVSLGQDRMTPVKLLFIQNQESDQRQPVSPLLGQLQDRLSHFCTELNSKKISADLIAEELDTWAKVIRKYRVTQVRRPTYAVPENLLWEA